MTLVPYQRRAIEERRVRGLVREKAKYAIDPNAREEDSYLYRQDTMLLLCENLNFAKRMKFKGTKYEWN